MSLIKRLREVGSFTLDTSYYGRDDKNLELYEDLTCEGKVVYTRFKDGGRWSNYETKVYEITEGDVTAYFEVSEEVPATENQEGGYFEADVYEVTPYEVKVTKYKRVIRT